MDHPDDVPLSVEEAKMAFLEDEGPRPSARNWIADHPVEILGAAVALGVALAVFPRLRRIAVPVMAIAARRLLTSQVA